jgi:nitroreductase
MFIDLIRGRRSIRKYQPRPVEKEKVDLLVEAALRAPSSRGCRPWQFVVVTEPGMIARLAEAKPHGSAFLRDAPLAFVVCAATAESDVWVEDASIAAIFLHLAAADIGLGSCWIQIRLRDHDARQSATDYIAGLLGLPEGVAVEAIIAVGYPAEDKKPHSAASLPYGKVSRAHYGRKA